MVVWKFFDLRSRSWPVRKRSCCISVDPCGRPEHICGVFIALALVSSKNYCRKTASELFWPEMTFATWRGITGRNIPTQGVNSTWNPMFESASNGFLPKEAPFIFLPLTYNGAVAKLTWPWVTDMISFDAPWQEEHDVSWPPHYKSREEKWKAPLLNKNHTKYSQTSG